MVVHRFRNHRQTHVDSQFRARAVDEETSGRFHSHSYMVDGMKVSIIRVCLYRILRNVLHNADPCSSRHETERVVPVAYETFDGKTFHCALSRSATELACQRWIA